MVARRRNDGEVEEIAIGAVDLGYNSQASQIGGSLSLRCFVQSLSRRDGSRRLPHVTRLRVIPPVGYRPNEDLIFDLVTKIFNHFGYSKNNLDKFVFQK